ncbi:uncharacterized protein DUF2530 [Jatrophihabitans sp. GAS493]|uniref:DUF2530 domain-containing protein n=1 Tax=Jatrophihabitans sp. GAS493 TaxID=1907575 RepID=UPI000BB7FA23|nr:DUF2530 domain-containing protein [Jatrophihabitans sp. GAS493]SOD70433.1 uncharacterized protein DUF2530 [Jatrophihabitans sp. GAS493]
MTDQRPAAATTPTGAEKSSELIVVEPVTVDSRRILTVLTGLWLLALIVLTAMWSWLGTHGHRDWLWTALAGTLLGLAGIVLAGRHRSEGRTR